MTLAAILLPEAPIVVSDVLLSHLGEPQVDLTPTGVFVRPAAGPKVYRPVDFIQKTHLLDEDRAAFTGAGKVSTLKSLAVDLRDRIRKGMVREQLEGWLESKRGICGSSTTAMVAWLDDNGYCVGRVGRDVTALTLEGGQTVFCTGSGVPWLKRNLITESNSLETVGDFNLAERVRFLAIAQTAQHLAQEWFLGMRDAFGAGFQVTYYDGTRFVAVPQIVYLVLRVDHDGSGSKEIGLAGPVIVQRSDGRRLAFEQWITESKKLTISDEGASLRSRVRFNEKVVPPLLHARSEAYERPTLATGDYVGVQLVHFHEGRLTGVGSFQLAGDPRLSGVVLGREPDGAIVLTLERKLVDIWMNKFNAVRPTI